MLTYRARCLLDTVLVGEHLRYKFWVPAPVPVSVDHGDIVVGADPEGIYFIAPTVALVHSIAMRFVHSPTQRDWFGIGAARLDSYPWARHLTHASPNPEGAQHI